MRVRIKPYPFLYEDLAQKLKFSNENKSNPFGYSASYPVKNGAELPLSIDILDEERAEFSITDSQNSRWIIDRYPLKIKLNLSFLNPEVLFDENGIAGENDTLGIALRWESADSRRRGISDGVTFSSEDGPVKVSLEVFFRKPGMLRGKVRLCPVLYLEKHNISARKWNYADRKGTILGELDGLSMNILFDGDSSVFPIYEVEKGVNDPLWTLHCDWENPNEDQFDESFGIYINRNNSRYKYLNMSDKNFDPDLMSEIVSHCLFVAITKLKEDGDFEALKNDGDFDEGSVSEAFRYYYDSMEWDWTTLSSLDSSIRNYLRKGML